MPTNTKEYMKEYQRWRRNPDKYKKPTKINKKKEAIKSTKKEGIKGKTKDAKREKLTSKITTSEKQFLKKIIIKATHRRIITQKESETALNILYK